MSINYPISPSMRHLSAHTESLLLWSVGVLAIVGLVAFVCDISKLPLVSNTLAATTAQATTPPR